MRDRAELPAESNYPDHLDTLTQRYIAALEASNADRALIFAGPTHLRSRDDQPYPFKVDPYFAQWLPLPQASESLIEFIPGQKPHLIFAQSRDFWHAAQTIPTGAWTGYFDVSITEPARTAQQLNGGRMRTILIGDSTVATESLAIQNATIALQKLNYTRAYKTEYELDCIAAANSIAVQGHLAVAQMITQPVSEFDLHLEYCAATQHEENELPYPNIIGMNEHAAILHYQNRQRSTPPLTRSLLIDAGAISNNYAADVTRTYSLRTGRFADLLAAMERLQQSVCAAVKANVSFVELNDYAHQLLSDLLAEHELLRCTGSITYERGLSRYFLPHGLGHLLGLQVHDVGGHMSDSDGNTLAPPQDHPFLRLTRRLDTGFVVTIEPGLYFIPSLLAELKQEAGDIVNFALIDELLPYGGIRIEDNVEVELLGCKNITRAAFTAIQEH